MKNLVVKEKRSSRPLKQKQKLKLNLKRPKKTKNVVSKKKTRNLRRLKWKPTHIAADPPTMPDPISAPCPHEEFHPAPDLSSVQMWEEIKVATKKKFARGKKHSLGSLEQCFIEFEEDLEELKASYALEYGDQDTNSKGKNCGCCMEVGFEYCEGSYGKCKGADFFAYCSDSEF